MLIVSCMFGLADAPDEGGVGEMLKDGTVPVREPSIISRLLWKEGGRRWEDVLAQERHIRSRRSLNLRAEGGGTYC